MNRQLEIPGVGAFELETIPVAGEDYRYYVCKRPGTGPDPLQIVIYPDGEGIGAAYAAKVRATVAKVAAEARQMIGRAEPLIRELMADYGLDVPDEFAALVAAQHLTHIKVGKDWAELIFDTCPFFPNFDLNVQLDDDVEIAKVWFDG